MGDIKSRQRGEIKRMQHSPYYLCINPFARTTTQFRHATILIVGSYLRLAHEGLSTSNRHDMQQKSNKILPRTGKYASIARRPTAANQ